MSDYSILVLTILVSIFSGYQSARASDIDLSITSLASDSLTITTTVTTTTGTSNTTTSTIVEAWLTIESGWNLVGTGAGGTLNVASAFDDPTKIESVWTWVHDKGSWGFYSPSLTETALADYAAERGFDVLSTIGPGEGFWVNAKQKHFATWQSGGEIQSAVFQEGKPGALKHGWNLISIAGGGMTPSEFNADIGVSSPASAEVIPINISSLWAWDTELNKWYFYAPDLEAQGGSALIDYIDSKGYLDFTTNNKTLHADVGFWVNKP